MLVGKYRGNRLCCNSTHR